MVKLFEPLMLLLMGGVVLFIVMAIFAHAEHESVGLEK